MAKHRAERPPLRWPWQPAPGMVRIGRKEYVALLEKANRSYRLEAEALELEAEQDRLRAARDAEALIAAQARMAGLQLARADVDGLLAGLPVTDGRLHADALHALVGQRLLEQRLGAQIPTTTDDPGDPR